MNYEKKLILAKEALESGSYDKETIEYIFPELKECEDERIRKKLIEYFNAYPKDYYCELKTSRIIAWLEKQGDTNETINMDEFAQSVLRGAAINLITWIDYNAAEGNMCLSNIECKDIEDALVSGNWDKIYAYIKKKLEKQGEQNPTDKLEPKFKQGEWIVWKDKNYKVNYNGCGYELFDQNDLSTSWDYKTIEDNAHLWTVQDAKDGDVLVTNSNIIFIFKHLDEGGTIAFRASCNKNSGVYFPNLKERLCDQDVYPATKEQRNLLFQKMHEAGYEWDAQEERIKSIEKKPAWSEDDENILEAITYTIKNSGYSHCIGVSIKVMIDWLKLLKERMKGE